MELIACCMSPSLASDCHLREIIFACRWSCLPECPSKPGDTMLYSFRQLAADLVETGCRLRTYEGSFVGAGLSCLIICASSSGMLFNYSPVWWRRSDIIIHEYIITHECDNYSNIDLYSIAPAASMRTSRELPM